MGVLSADADGRLRSERALPSAFMAPRLQGKHQPDGVIDLSLWGAGALGRLRVTAMAGPFLYAPNHVAGRGSALWVARSAPALLLRGVRFRRFTPARKSAAWDPADAGLGEVRREGARWIAERPWGLLLIEARGEDLIVCGGTDRAEAERGAALSADAIETEGAAYLAGCDRLPEGDPLLRSLVMQGAHAALSCVRRDHAGRFAGLAAGLAYSAPARTYFRDGYWTLPMLLRVEPAAATAQVELLASAVQADGEAPSGVLAPGPAQAGWEAQRRERSAAVHRRPAEWWSDHFDSPLLFVLAVADVAEATRDRGLVERCWPKIAAVFDRYVALSDADGLPLKPRHDRDWADNVFRGGWVAYDLGLWAGALGAVERLGRRADDDRSVRAGAALARLRAGVERRLWRSQGWYADYATPAGASEDHLTLDSLMLLRFGAAPPERAEAVLDAAGARLESRRNTAQRWGDWGMLCAWPPYARRGDLRAKTAFPFRYHNGGDWPWLDGVYADELLRRGRGGWRYPLTRWWQTCLERGWTGPVEWFSPPFGRGSLLQAWSSLPAAVALAHRGTVLAGDPLA